VLHDPSSTSTVQNKFQAKQLSLTRPSQKKAEPMALIGHCQTAKHPLSSILQNGVERKSVTISFSKKKERQMHEGKLEVAKSARRKITISFNENPNKAQRLTSIRGFEV